jgi:hypothetical protein
VTGRARTTLLGVLLIAGLVGGPSFAAGAGTGGATTTDTTMLVYLVGQDDGVGNLFPFHHLEEVMEVGSTAGTKVLVQTGGSRLNRGGRPASRKSVSAEEIDWSRIQRYLVKKGSLALLDDSIGEASSSAPRPDVDMGNATTLENFLRWGVRNYPARRYVVVLESHGAGVNGGFGPDAITRSYISVPELGEALARVATTERITFDLVAFNACYMGNAEVAASLASSSRYMVASETPNSGFGWDHGAVLRYLEAHPRASGREIGIQIADTFKAKLLTFGTGYLNITMSVIDLSKMGAVVEATDAFALRLLPYAQRTDGWLQIAKARVRSLDWGTVAMFGSAMDLVDMRTFVSKVVDGIGQLAPDPLLASAGSALDRALQAAIVHNVAGSSNAGATGLTVYFPSILDSYHRDYPTNTSTPGGSPFFSSVYAGGLLEAYHAYYLRHRKALEASIAWSPRGGPLAATISNDFDYALAAHHAVDCSYVGDDEPALPSATGGCYDAMRLAGKATPTRDGGWTTDAAYDDRWPHLTGADGRPQPVALLPDQVALTKFGQHGLHLIPAYLKPVDDEGPFSGYQQVFLSVEEVPSAAGRPSAYRVNGWEFDVESAGARAELRPLTDGEVFALGVYVLDDNSTPPRHVFLRSSREVTVAGGKLDVTLRQITGGQFNYFVADLTGAIQWPSGGPRPYAARRMQE